MAVVDYLGSRREWYLPLFGGAEMNRIKRPKVVSLVSKLYPLEVEDSVISGPPGFFTADPVFWSEDMLTSVAFSGGTLREPLWEIGYQEQLETSIGFLNGTLVAPLVTYTVPAEKIQTALSFTDGTLRTVLIQYTNWPTQIADESVQTSMVFSNGTLT